MSSSERVKATAAEYRQQAQALEAKAKFLEELEDAINANPELKPLVRDMVAPDGRASVTVGSGSGKRITLKEDSAKAAVRAKGKSVGKLLAWFQTTGNQPATLNEMAEAISLGRASIRQMVYMTYPEKFKKTGKRDGTRESLFMVDGGGQQ